MYSVWLNDLPNVITALHQKLPYLSTFCSIEGNANGDYVVRNETDTWIVKHKTFTVWHLDRSKKNWGIWIEI